ncbi:hypothetical protein CHU98_g12339 [Xylaria longipes]|nr:hypothetical protein CHU98_g12339 [Xylaria longipes]
MLEYFTFKKVKKHREEKAAAEKQKIEIEQEGKEKQATSETPASTSSPRIISTPADDDNDVAIEGTPVLDPEDEKFLERLTSSSGSHSTDQDEDETPPPLPPRVKTPIMDIDSDDGSSVSSKKERSKPTESKGKEKESQKPSDGNKPKRFTFSLRRKPVPSTQPGSPSEGLHPTTNNNTLTVPEAHTETSEMAHLLDDLDLSAKNNRAFSLSSESAEMARRFTQVLRDLINGVPTAYGDLVNLIEDRDGVLARNYEKLPGGLKKLVARLPDKLTSSLAPELLAVAAEAQGLEASKDGGLKGAAKKFLTPGNLHDIVTKPGALVGLLKGIVNALKTRFPAFIGTNVLWSLAIFLLLSMLWYCHKRGREVRLEREATEKEKAEGEGEGEGEDTIDGRPRVEELPDDPLLPAPAPEPETSSAGAGARE